MHRTRTPLIFALPRALLLALLCYTLGGCVVVPFSVNHSSTLPKSAAAPSAGGQALAATPVPIAYIVRLLPDPNPGQMWEGDLEGRAWREALAGLAAPEHIVVVDLQAAMTEEFTAFCQSHPVVDIQVRHEMIDKSFLAGLRVMAVGAVDLLSLGLVPAPAYRAPLSVQFNLTLPREQGREARADNPEPKPEQTATPEPPQYTQQEYRFERTTSLAPLILLPTGDDYAALLATPIGAGWGSLKDLTDWRVEEKRRLLARFLQDARATLEQYAQQQR